jgi:membrane associated rhomboid family serine protease
LPERAQSCRRAPRAPVWAALALAGCALAASASAPLAEALEDRSELESGGRLELWRPLTGHLVHGSPLHLALNLALFAPLAWCRERRRGAAGFVVEYLLLAAAVALGVRLLHEGWTSYRGLSGVIYGLLCLSLIEGARPGPAFALAALAAGALGLKSLAETLAGGWLLETPGLGESLGIVFLPASHLAGVAAGVVLGLLLRHCHGASSSAAVCRGSELSRSAPITATPAAPVAATAAAPAAVMPPRA